MPAMRSPLLYLPLAALALLLATFAPALAEERPLKQVAMILFRGETPAEQGFRDALNASAKYRVRFTVFDARQNKQRLQEILAKLPVEQYDLVYTFGTMATQLALQRIKERPVIFNVVQRPIEAGIAQSWKSSGNNASGASNIVSTESAFKTLALVLNIRKLGFIYYDKDPAPLYQKADIEQGQRKFGFRMVDFPVPDAESIPGILKRIVNAKVDAVMFPSDSFIKGHADQVVSALNKHRIASIVIIPEMVQENGALLSLGPDYYELGQLAGECALEVLGGRKPAQVPIRTVQNLRVSINLKTADRLGINFPLQLLSLSTVVR